MIYNNIGGASVARAGYRPATFVIGTSTSGHTYDDCDYLFHFNANMKFIAPIGDEILPQKENGYICVCEWLNHKLKSTPDKFPYERNKESLAYIPIGEGKHYFMSGVHGGRKKE